MATEELTVVAVPAAVAVPLAAGGEGRDVLTRGGLTVTGQVALAA